MTASSLGYTLLQTRTARDPAAYQSFLLYLFEVCRLGHVDSWCIVMLILLVTENRPKAGHPCLMAKITYHMPEWTWHRPFDLNQIKWSHSYERRWFGYIVISPRSFGSVLQLTCLCLQPGSDSGTTAVVALIRGKQLIVANAGDSRCVVSERGRSKLSDSSTEL